MTPCIVFTGGGTAGHVTPNLALIARFQQMGWKTAYIGSDAGVERTLVQDSGVAWYAIRSGKWRRYFSWKNLTDPIGVLVGICQSLRILHALRPKVVFSKGGFVAVPVVFAAWLLRIPVVSHESDMTPGLANRLSLPFVKTLCVNFEAFRGIPGKGRKVVVSGLPLRESLFHGDASQGRKICGFGDEKPCLLVIGGSLGSRTLNTVIRGLLPVLLKSYHVIHLCGKGNLDPALEGTPDYCQLEYATDILPDLFACASIVVSRAGANTLCELLALEKPHVLIPLSGKASRGDQIENARYFQELGVSEVVDEDGLTAETLLSAMEGVMQRRDALILKIRSLASQNGTDKVMEVILSEART